MILSCTKKVLDKLKKYKTTEQSKEEIGFYNWYVDEVKIGRKAYFLFTHSETLFSFIAYLGTQNNLKKIEAIFTKTLQETIIREVGTLEEYQDLLFPKDEDFRFMKTNSRKVLGSMNEFKFQIECYLDDLIGFDDMEDIINHRLNKVLMGKDRTYITPKDEMLKALQGMLNK